MKRLRFLSILLAMSLLTGQWLCIAHAAEHTAYQQDDALCMLCVQGQNLQQAQVDHVPALDLDAQVQAPAETAAIITASCHRNHTDIRAPPRSVHI